MLKWLLEKVSEYDVNEHVFHIRNERELDKQIALIGLKYKIPIVIDNIPAFKYPANVSLSIKGSKRTGAISYRGILKNKKIG